MEIESMQQKFNQEDKDQIKKIKHQFSQTQSKTINNKTE